MAKTFYSTGRRKTASARVFLKTGKGSIQINKKSINEYFPYLQQQKSIQAPLKITQTAQELDVNVTVRGGGITGQCEAIRHGLSRALIEYSSSHREILKKNGFLTRDPRSVERKKCGRHKARKSTQFSKR